jgi:hypothetical protein
MSERELKRKGIGTEPSNRTKKSRQAAIPPPLPAAIPPISAAAPPPPAARQPTRPRHLDPPPPPLTGKRGRDTAAEEVAVDGQDATQSATNCYSNNPVRINKLNPYTIFKPDCDGEQLILGEENMPKLELSEQIPGGQITGLKAPISIVKIRKESWVTLASSLYNNAEERTRGRFPQGQTGIYRIIQEGKSLIRIIVQPNQNGLTYNAIDETFDLCALKEIFLNAQEDEVEDSENIIEEEDDDEEERGNSRVKGLTRENLRDTNPSMRKLDEEILKIISILFVLSKINNQIWSKKAKDILYSFMVVSSEKEYLDTGQLYAICKPTIDYNNNNNYDDASIKTRCEANFAVVGTGVENFQYSEREPRKPMLETIDGAATRIASNQYFTSYCNFKLKDNTEGLDASFYIDNNNVFLLALWFSDDMIVKTEREKILSKYIRNNKITAETIRKYNLLFSKNTNNISIQIDVCYCILSNVSLFKLLKELGNSLIRSSKTALLMNNELYFIASVACFLHKYNNNNNIVNNLIECNFDPLCHDNGESKIYRLVMILMFILKNSSGIIAMNLHKMFPRFFLPSAYHNVINWNDRQINEEAGKTKIMKELIFIQGNYNTYITYIFAGLDADQKRIFKILGSVGASNVENGLYLRLLDKSCYVFPVLHAPMVIIVNAANSAHTAFRPAQQVVRSNPSLFKLSALDQGVIIPHYTNCAIDAPLKHGLSLSNYDIRSVNSNVYVTAVTRNDAASQNMSNAFEYTDPICIKIMIDNLFERDLEANNTFTYKFIYGNTINTLVESKICPPALSGEGEEEVELCERYFEILDYLQKTKFFYKKRNTGPFRDEIYRGAESLFENIANPPPTSGIDNPTAELFRDKLSRLFYSSICGPVTVKKPKCSDTKITEEKMNEGKLQFINFLIDYISSKTPANLNEIRYLLSYTYYLLEFTKETKNLDNMIINVNKYVNPMDFFSEEDDDDLSGGEVLMGVPPPIKDARYLNPELTVPISKKQDFKAKDYNSFKIKVIPTAKGIQQATDSNAVSINYTLPHNLQLSYTSLFGEYGFCMDINEDGEYELNVLNSEADYNNYLKRYNLDIPQQPTVQQPTVQQPTVPSETSGGKIKTRKSRIFKHKTRKIQKLRNKRYTRKNIKKLIKRKTRHTH